MENFRKKLIESLFGNLLRYILNLLFPLIVARLYTPEIFGKYTYAISIISLLIFMCTLGLDTGLLYFIPRNGKKYVLSAFTVNLIMSSAIIAILFFTVEAWMRPFLPLIWLLSVENMFFSLYRTNQKIKEFFTISGFLNISVKIGVSALLFFIAGARLGNLIIATYSAGIFSTILYMLQNRKMFEGFHISRELITYSIPLIIGGMVSVIIQNTDLIMISNMIGETEVALYKVGTEISNFPSILLMVVNTVFPPVIASLYHRGELDRLRGLYKKITRWLALTSFIIISLLLVFRQNLLSLYGGEFLAAQNVLFYRAVGQMVNAAVGSVWYIIIMTGHPKINMYGKFAACIINVGLNFILIPFMGIDGAAFASMMSTSFINILGYSIVKKILKVKVFGFI